MTAVILAAGIASRLRPLTDTLPKCLLPVGDRTILARTIHHLIGQQIIEIVIVTGYRDGQIRDFVSGSFPGLNVWYIHNEEYLCTNNIYSLWLAAQALRRREILLLDSDIMFDAGIIELLKTSDHESCLAMNSQHSLGEEEIKVHLRPDGSVQAIGKDIPVKTAAGESIGIEKFGPSTFATLTGILERMIRIERRVDVFYEAAFQELIDRGGILHAVDVGARKCIEIDTMEDLDRASRLFASRGQPGKAARSKSTE